MASGRQLADAYVAADCNSPLLDKTANPDGAPEKADVLKEPAKFATLGACKRLQNQDVCCSKASIDGMMSKFANIKNKFKDKRKEQAQTLTRIENDIEKNEDSDAEMTAAIEAFKEDAMSDDEDARRILTVERDQSMMLRLLKSLRYLGTKTNGRFLEDKKGKVPEKGKEGAKPEVKKEGGDVKKDDAKAKEGGDKKPVEKKEEVKKPVEGDKKPEEKKPVDGKAPEKKEEVKKPAPCDAKCAAEKLAKQKGEDVKNKRAADAYNLCAKTAKGDDDKINSCVKEQGEKNAKADEEKAKKAVEDKKAAYDKAVKGEKDAKEADEKAEKDA